jgi:hypothetical protein
MSDKPETDRDEEVILNDDLQDNLKISEDFINHTLS